ncbi:Coronin-like protein crn1 [Fusarium falciforme]|nr:Coronin-like protein crn1 [Fusarium falciforme]
MLEPLPRCRGWVKRFYASFCQFARFSDEPYHSEMGQSWSASPPGRVPEEASLQLPRIPASRAISSPAPTGSGIPLADIRQLLEDQTKQLLESLARQLDSQSRQISLLTAEVESLKRKASSHSQVGEWPSVDNDDSDSDDTDGDSVGEDDSTEPKSAQCRNWTAPDEALLGRLKFAQSITAHHLTTLLLRNWSAKWMR